jgi:hypothetical protein
MSIRLRSSVCKKDERVSKIFVPEAIEESGIDL